MQKDDCKAAELCSRSVPCLALVPTLSHAFSGTGKLLKKGRLAFVFVLVPPFFMKRNGCEIFTPFSPVFHALVKNATDCISILTAVLAPFFTISRKSLPHVCHRRNLLPDGDESNDNSPFSILSYHFPWANTKVRETLNFPLLA